ncbi:ferredoxin--NADP reductase [Shewanella psychropiezotolerans]|uniref:ferredoxin--NADP(+) reductase n=1 Tax=Shewanella psychropiezotolerans TaxID=2593655 RepID=A0ABX5X2G7_9GAMM|nr:MULTISPECIES: ferredoxin--NADP reductase [Shewanella]MPY23465.1 ferredoxin--NADP reductase [Shewanella sp. YLB-07]QDO85545.1 ferredoxin--NADP reductase [Shewanella psychropiezotolerans]
MWIEGEVVGRVDWNDKLFSLKIRADVQPFIAGQFIKLSQVMGDKRVGRAYSIVNSPGGDIIEVLAVSVEDGQLSPNLQQLKVGDKLDVSPKASGFMTLEEIPNTSFEGKQLWLLATGTAVGPFISMLETDEPWNRFETVVLVYGVRLAEDLAYKEQLLQLERRYPNQFKLVFSVTREDLPEAIQTRISIGIQSGEIQKLVGVEITAQDSQVMLCGNPDMISDTNKILLDMGLAKNLRRAPGQITVEKYW